MLQFLSDNPYTRSLLVKLDSDVTLDFDEWALSNATRRLAAEFPETEAERAKVCYEILKRCGIDDEEDALLKWGHVFSAESQYDLMLRDLIEAVVDPFVNYLHDRIEETGNVLYLIERFKLKTEWFRREEMYGLYSKNTQIGEAQLDRELRLSLFEGGVEYPFSQPASPSGKADVVALLDTDDPLVLEIKVFDPDRSKSKDNVRQGFHQVLKYAADYNKNIGYLVVFNCSLRTLSIMNDQEATQETVVKITYAGKTFFVVSIDINPDTVPASKEQPRSRVTINASDLVGE